MSIQLIRAQIAQHKAAEFQSRKGLVPDSELAERIKRFVETNESPAYMGMLQKRLDWLTELLRLQTKLTDTVAAQERCDLEWLYAKS